MSGVNSGEGVGGGGGGGGAPTYGNVADALATPTTPTTTTTIGGPLTVQGTDLRATSAAGLTVENVTAATALETVQFAPIVLWKGSAWVAGAARTMQARVVLEVETSGALVLLFQRDETGGGFTTAFRFDTSGTQFDARLYAFAMELGGGSSIVFANNSGMYQRGATGALEMKSRSEDGPLELYSEVTGGANHPFRIYAAGETRGATGTILIYGDDDGAGNFVERGRIMGDGLIEAPTAHVDATVYTNASPPASTAPHGSYKVDLSGGDVAIPLPTPSASNLGRTIEVNQAVAGTDDMVFTPVTGLVEGTTSMTITGLASAPLASVTLRNIGGTTGWKIVSLA